MFTVRSILARLVALCLISTIYLWNFGMPRLEVKGLRAAGPTDAAARGADWN